MRRIPEFIVKWDAWCEWCNGEIMHGDNGSYDLEHRVCHLECRKMMAE